MTRFWMTLDQAVWFVLTSIEQMYGGEVFIPKIPSMRVTDLADVIAPDCGRREIGIRPGEKLHETLLSEDEARHSLELHNQYVITPMHPWWKDQEVAAGLPLCEDFRYSSDTNSVWLTKSDLQELLGELAVENGAVAATGK